MTAGSNERSGSTARLSVIVAEDDELLRRYFVDVLELGGHEALPARDGRDALDLLSARPDVAVLITDIEMPRIDGFALARRARQRHGEIPILYVSSCERVEVARGAVRGSAFLAKPFSPHALLEALLALSRSQ